VPLPPVLALSTVGIVVLVAVALLVLLVLGGIVASGRAARARETRLRAAIERADQELAAARADDNGWEPTQMEGAVRSAWDAGHPHGEAIAELQLVQVVDRPGTDADEAVYRVVGAGGHEHEIVLKRVDGAWTT
jgi:type II secretory pathway pseudopilin PulG